MKFRVPISAVVAGVVGVLVLLGYFLDFLRATLLQWATGLAAFALLVGVVNLLRHHAVKVRKGAFTSLVTLFFFFLTIAVVVVEMVLTGSGPTGKWSLWFFNSFAMPVEMSLMAVLVVVLAYAGARMLRRRVNLMSIIFLVTALVVLIGTTPLYMIGPIKVGGFDVLNWLHNLVVQVGAVGGARGLLLGVALGTVVTGVRILMGVDRPYGG